MRRIAALLAALTAVFASSGCSFIGSAGTDEFTVVSSNSVYDRIAKDLWSDAGPAKFVTLLDNWNTDPHSFEPSAKQRLYVANADLVILAGTDADQYMSTMLENTNYPIENMVTGTSNRVIAACGKGLSICLERQMNPHLWFDLENVRKVADDITAKYKENFPGLTNKLDLNLTNFKLGLDAIENHFEFIAPKLKAKGFFAPESIANVMMLSIGATDLTPKEISTKFANEVELSTKEMQQAKELLASGAIDVFIANVEVESQQAQQLLDYAESLDIPVVKFSENNLCLKEEVEDGCEVEFYQGYRHFANRVLELFGKTYDA